VFRRLQLSDELTNDFGGIVHTLVQGLEKTHADGDLLLHRYEAGARSLPHELEWILLPENPTLAAQIDALGDLNEIPLFMHDDDEFIAHLRFYVIVLSQRNQSSVYFFRVYSPKQELHRSRWLLAMFADGQYDSFAQPGLLFDRSVDCVSSGDHLFILNKNNFQRIFGFFEMVREAARETLAIIQASIPIVNFDDFQVSCERHLHKLAKINNIARSPYLREITMDQLIAGIREFRLDIEVVTENGEKKLRYNPRDKWALLKLLDDDFLNSIMTGNRYEATGKRSLDNGAA
jgi:hypothetical protein